MCQTHQRAARQSFGRVVQKTPMGEIRVLFETTNPVPKVQRCADGLPLVVSVPILRGCLRWIDLPGLLLLGFDPLAAIEAFEVNLRPVPQCERTAGGGTQVALSDFRLIREANGLPTDFVWLTYVEGGQTYLVSISRADVDDFAQQKHPRAEQDALVEKNLETLGPVVRGKRERGEATQHTNRQTGRTDPLIELTRDDLEQGIKRSPVVSSSPIGTEVSASVAAGGQATGRATLTFNVTPGPPKSEFPVQSYLVTTPLILDASLVSLTLRFGEGFHNLLPEHVSATLADEFAGWVRLPVASGSALLDRLATVGTELNQSLRAAIIEALDEWAAALQFSDPRSFRLVDLEKLATGLVAFAKLPRRDLVVGVVRVAGCVIFLCVVLGVGSGLQDSTHHAVTEIANAMVDRIAQRLRAGDSPPR
jgi:hypothetical protein